MDTRRPVATLFAVLADIFIVLAVIETIRLVVLFFGGLAGTGAGEAFIALTDRITLPVGLRAIKTPSGGAFDLDTVATIVVFVVAEWVLGALRSRAQ